MTTDPDVAALQTEVKAAQQEFDLAVQFHETWKPMAYDEALRDRVGVSYATNTFLTIRVALRRETLLALMRVWDRNPHAVKMSRIGDALTKAPIIDALARSKSVWNAIPEARERVISDVAEAASAAVSLISKYDRRGSHHHVFERLNELRNERLAHRQIKMTATSGPDATDEEIEQFYQDTSTLIQLLSHAINAEAFDPQDFASVYRHHAKFFWAAVRGERTPGHPNYRPPPTPQAVSAETLGG